MKGTISYRSAYNKIDRKNLVEYHHVCYVDASWSGEVERKSITCDHYKEMSSTGPDYISLTTAIAEGIWVFKELGQQDMRR